jgi:hypothetical protein
LYCQPIFVQFNTPVQIQLLWVLICSRQQLEISRLKTVVDYFALHGSLADSLTESIVCMSIPKRINMGSVYKISFAINTYGQVAAFAFEVKLAFPTRRFHHLYLFGGIGDGDIPLFGLRIGRKCTANDDEQAGY